MLQLQLLEVADAPAVDEVLHHRRTLLAHLGRSTIALHLGVAGAVASEASALRRPELGALNAPYQDIGAVTPTLVCAIASAAIYTLSIPYTT